MRNFNSALTNEDPYADADLYANIGHWYWVLFLTAGNLAGIPAAILAYLLAFYFLSWVLSGSMVVSILYHLCQTTGYCGRGMRLLTWVSYDHFTATLLLATYVLFFFLSRSSKEIEKQQQKISSDHRTHRSLVKNKTTTSAMINISDNGKRKIKQLSIKVGGEDEVEEEEEDNEYDDTLYEQIGTHEENMIYDAYSSFCIYFTIIFLYIQVYLHPFSYHAFINVLTLVLLLGLFKIIVLNEGNPKNLKNRVSWPELIIGIILAAIGLICYVLDGFLLYEVLHTLWHIFIYLSLYFQLLGLAKNSPYYHSIWRFLYDGTMKRLCCCCCRRRGRHHRYQPGQ